MSQKNFSCSIRSVELYRAAVEQNGEALQDIPEPLRTADFCLAAVKQFGRALEFVPRPLRAEVLAKIEEQTPGGGAV